MVKVSSAKVIIDCSACDRANISCKTHPMLENVPICGEFVSRSNNSGSILEGECWKAYHTGEFQSIVDEITGKVNEIFCR